MVLGFQNKKLVYQIIRKTMERAETEWIALPEPISSQNLVSLPDSNTLPLKKCTGCEKTCVTEI